MNLSDPACSCASGDIHWSSTTRSGEERVVWIVDFESGTIDNQFKSGTRAARAVRGGT
jgi:hypothetical protein